MKIETAAGAFCMEGNPVRFETLGHGHINDTLCVTTDTGNRYVLQKINQYVFHDPVRLMENAGAVSAFLRQRAEDPRQALRFLTTKSGGFCYQDPEGDYWRAYGYVEGFSLDAPESDEDFYQSALAFGRFQQMLTDFPAETLYETIPEFHNTIDRYRQLKESIAADPCARLKNAGKEVEFLLANEAIACTLQRMREAGELPLRVTHNDTKLNNVLLDRATRKSLCILDLDTVMPGLSVYDFGDSIRFGAATAPEDEPDTGKMKLDLRRFAVYTKGYLEAATCLTEREVAMLPMGALVMTMEVAARFLKDYLDGDKYFKVAYPEHNLVRAKAQIALARDMLAKLPEMENIVAQLGKEGK